MISFFINRAVFVEYLGILFSITLNHCQNGSFMFVIIVIIAIIIIILIIIIIIVIIIIIILIIIIINVIIIIIFAFLSAVANCYPCAIRCKNCGKYIQLNTPPSNHNHHDHHHHILLHISDARTVKKYSVKYSPFESLSSLSLSSPSPFHKYIRDHSNFLALDLLQLILSFVIL